MKFAILTSGGDAPGMNAAIRAVVRSAINHGDEVYGVYDGYKGLVLGSIFKIERENVSEILNRGGTILRTARLEEFKDKNIRKKAIENLKEYEIDVLICIGGDGTYTGALRLYEEGFNTICIPGTIDNDIALTDYTIGFSTALSTACDAIDKLKDTSTSHQRCSIIEVMGRHCPDLAIYSSLCCGAEYIITDKSDMKDENILIESLKSEKAKGRRHAIIIVAENITNIYQLAKRIEISTGYETRATILGYVQRGGVPTPEDRILATRFGDYAVSLAHKKVYGVATSIFENRVTYKSLNEILTTKNEYNEDFYEIFKNVR